MKKRSTKKEVMILEYFRIYKSCKSNVFEQLFKLYYYVYKKTILKR